MEKSQNNQLLVNEDKLYIYKAAQGTVNYPSACPWLGLLRRGASDYGYKRIVDAYSRHDESFGLVGIRREVYEKLLE